MGVTMRFQRVSVAHTEVEVIEQVWGDYAVLWLLPHHGYYPSLEIATAVARGHQCNASTIQKVEFCRNTMAGVEFPPKSTLIANAATIDHVGYTFEKTVAHVDKRCGQAEYEISTIAKLVTDNDDRLKDVMARLDELESK
jgi:hypothetical protein